MINKSVFEDALIAGMQRNLVSKDQEKAMSNITQAVDYLHSAAEILDNANLSVQADRIVNLLTKIASIPEEKEESIEASDTLDDVEASIDRFLLTSFGGPAVDAALEEELLELGVTPDDILKMLRKDNQTIAKVNAHLIRRLAGNGLSGPEIKQKIKQLLGSKYVMTVEEIRGWLTPKKSKQDLLDEIARSKGLTPAKRDVKPGDILPITTRELDLGPTVSPKKDLKPGDVISLRTASDVQQAKDPRKISDKHTKNLTPEKMIANLKHHGTVFNMADDGADTAKSKPDSDDCEANDGVEELDLEEPTFEEENS